MVLSCNTTTQEETKQDTLEVPKEAMETKKGVAPISTDSGSLIQEVNKPAMLLFGQNIEAEYGQLYATLQLVSPALIRQISNTGTVMTGPLVFYYNQVPTQGENISMFIGIPVKNKFKNEGETQFINLPAASYYRMDCNAEAGRTWEYHVKMQNILKHKKLSFDAPVLELISESRNNEMTVISKASLLYKKK